VTSAALATSGLAGLVYGAAHAADHPWSDPEVWGPALAGFGLLAAFAFRQSRSAAPMLPLMLLRDRRRLLAYLAIASGVVASFGLSLMLTYYFQAALGWSPLHTGLAFLPLSAAVAASGYLVSGVLARTLSARWLTAAGLALAATGIGVLATLDVHSSYLTTVLPAEILVGLGMGGIFTPAIQVVTSGVAPRDAGVAAAVANVAMQVGGSLGVAVLNSIAVSATHGYTGDPRAALVHGYATAAAWVAAALVVVVLMVVAGLSRRPSLPAPASGMLAENAQKGAAR
jgi:hypothetical protein